MPLKPLSIEEKISAAKERGYAAWPSPHGQHPFGTDVWLVEMAQLLELRLSRVEEILRGVDAP